MTEKYCELTKDSYTVFTHSTGLPVCVVSRPGHAKIHAMFAANFGSVDRVVLPVPERPRAGKRAGRHRPFSGAQAL